MTPKMKQNKTTKTPPNIGAEIIRGLTGLRDALAEDACLPERFTMRSVELDLEPHDWSPDDIKTLREQLNASQPVFAKLIGASPKTVQSWEQGHEPPAMARRLLDLIQENPTPWKKILRDAAVVKSGKTTFKMPRRTANRD